ncbi:hypothetical protein KCG43_11150 [Photobacterium sp. WH24]|uniref:hypothetical protein n=1 Tax=Photobacterium sp. WH24 TaxID=2827237 RepID=UPI001C46A50A|nr:hypothetical protein [Photobacterium sp. WH24]MBV7262552.1 hypothetical protein [Photobacterium sp. WH24]
MHPLQNGSQVEVKPAAKPKVGPVGYFTEGGEGTAPSYPGADWFNAVIEEFKSVYQAAGLTFEPNKFDHLKRAISANIAEHSDPEKSPDPHSQYLNDKRLMTYGLGVGQGTVIGLPAISDVDNLDLPTKFYRLDPTTPNNPLNDYGVLIYLSRGSGRNIFQLALGHKPGEVLWRGAENGSLTSWEKGISNINLMDYGLGVGEGTGKQLPVISNVNDFTLQTKTYQLQASTTNNPLGEAGILVYISRGTGKNVYQVAIGTTSGLKKERYVKDGIASPWSTPLFEGALGVGGQSLHVDTYNDIAKSGFYYLLDALEDFEEAQGFINRYRKDSSNYIDLFISSSSETQGVSLKRVENGVSHDLLRLFDTKNCQLIRTENTQTMIYPNGTMIVVGKLPAPAGHSSYTFELAFKSPPFVMLQGLASQTTTEYQYNNQWLNTVSSTGYTFTKSNSQTLNFIAVGEI